MVGISSTVYRVDSETLANVCSAEKLTKGSSNTVLRLVSFSAGQTLLLGGISEGDH